MTGLDLAFRNVVQAGFRASFGAERDEIALVPIRSIAAGCAAMVSPSAVKIAAAGLKSRSNRV
jgi:hypothetical protein